MTTSSSPIASQSRRCSDLFVRLCDLKDHESNDPVRSIPPAACHDEFSRFQIWANNIGALLTVDYRNSLDVRLSRAAKVSSRILEFLGDLEEALNDVSSIAAGIKFNRVTIGSSYGLGPGVSESQEAFDIAKDSITSLMKTSILIRQATPRDRFVKANVSTKNPFIDSFDIAHVGHKFPKLDAEGRPWLKERLGKAITQRRQYLKYARDHHDKFKSAERDVEPPSAIIVQPDTLGSSSTSYEQARTAESLPVSTSAPTDASTLQTSKLRPFGSVPEDVLEDLLDIHSQTSYATSVVDSEDKGRLQPPSLEDITTSFPFECPYCWSMQKLKTERLWRKHLFADLRPYVCTFEECDLKLFADRHSWFEHELECHRVDWYCRFCSHSSFPSERNLKGHMQARHANVSSAPQLPALLQASKQMVDRVPAADCPLCDWEPILRNLNRGTPAEDTLVVTVNQFRGHLGSHMEQLALFALPRSFADEGANADSNEAAAAHNSSSPSHRVGGEEAMSYSTRSSHGVTRDGDVPGLSTYAIRKIEADFGSELPWSTSSLPFPNPFPRYDAAVAQTCSEEGYVYLHGGVTEESGVKSDLWIIKTTAPPTCTNMVITLEGPGSRTGHTGLLIDKSFIVFGGGPEGHGVDSLDSALYKFYINSRHWSRSKGKAAPAGRSGHAMNIVGSELVIFGGRVGLTYLNDLYALNLNELGNPEQYWENWSHATSDVPRARVGFTMVSWDDKLFLFGGRDRRMCLCDIWEFDPMQMIWTALDCTGYVPEAREHHAAAIVGGVMYIHGGRAEDGRDLGDLAALHIPNRHWYQFQNMGPSPSPRSGHSMTTHGSKIHVFGGHSSSGAGDKEELSLMYTLDTAKLVFPTPNL